MDTAESTATITFPEGFGWGTATASYQIEGAVDADGRSPSVWDVFSHTPGMITDGSNGDRADDHYRRWAEDVAIMADLGVNFYRFSLAWPRLQPDGRGELNNRGIDFYARLVDALLERGITPWVTLYHWDLPQVLEEAGGWPERDTAHRFADYSDRVFARLGDRISHWTTLNEPFCAGLLGYAAGVHAPGRHEPIAGIRAVHHLLLGHGLALDALRQNSAPRHEFGLTLNLSPVSPATSSDADVDAARRIDALANRLFLDPILTGSYPADLIADLEPLTRSTTCSTATCNALASPSTSSGSTTTCPPWSRRDSDTSTTTPPTSAPATSTSSRPGIPPPPAAGRSIRMACTGCSCASRSDYHAPPLWITENGAAYDDQPDSDGAVHDPDRIAYLDSHLRAAHRAIQDGADLRGYFVWTLLDNFEWSYGESTRFGLVHVDYDTQRRTLKDSAHWFAGVMARNGLETTAT